MNATWKENACKWKEDERTWMYIGMKMKGIRKENEGNEYKWKEHERRMKGKWQEHVMFLKPSSFAGLWMFQHPWRTKNMGGTGGLHDFHYWQQWQQWHLVKISITHWIPLIRSDQTPTASATALLGPPGETLCHGWPVSFVSEQLAVYSKIRCSVITVLTCRRKYLHKFAIFYNPFRPATCQAFCGCQNRSEAWTQGRGRDCRDICIWRWGNEQIGFYSLV